MCIFPIQPSTKCWILNLVPSRQNTEKSCSIKLKASFTLARRRTVNRNCVHGSKENIAAILYLLRITWDNQRTVGTIVCWWIWPNLNFEKCLKTGKSSCSRITVWARMTGHHWRNSKIWIAPLWIKSQEKVGHAARHQPMQFSLPRNA